MYPDIEYVFKKRYLLAIFYRTGVLILVVLGLLPIARMFFEGAVVLPLYYSRVIVIGNPASWTDLLAAYLPTSGGYLITAMCFAVLQTRLVYWIVPLPRPQCPQCGYDISKLAEPRCSECGLNLPREMVDQKDSS